MLRLLNLLKYSPVVRRSTLRHKKFSTSINIKPTPEVLNDSFQIQQGKVIHGFLVNDISRVDEMCLDVIKLTHLNTKAQYLHIARDDSNNVFSIGFRTTPMNSTGLPHILEHLSLCGSEKYPCRDPFFKMIRRSLATFLNAMTGLDYTFYPFSTQNMKDFRNLQSVYLDAVFKPLLRELDFRQEGWRLEHLDIDNKNSPIVFKGVVFNEMKGVFSNNQSIFVEKLINTILPDHTYAFISGGDPLVIPCLEYNDLLNFHRKYYHPSNANFYSYGNFPLEDHLKFVNDNYLDKMNSTDVSETRVPSQSRWNKPHKKHIQCRIDPMAADPNKQSHIAIAQLCNDITDIQTSFELHVLSQLLLKGPNSAFYKSLIDTNIGSGFGSLTGFHADFKDCLFSVNLQGVNNEDFHKIENIYNETLNKVMKDGFDKDHIEAVLHDIELSLKHESSNFGLNILYGLLSLWTHEGDVVKSLRIARSIETFKQNLHKDPKHLEKLIDRYLLKNNHRLTLTMSPDEKFDENNTKMETELLKSKLKDLKNRDREEIYRNGQDLSHHQDREEDLGILPTLTLKDIKQDVDRYMHKDIIIKDVPLQLSIEPTNGICYYRGIINTKELPDNLKSLVPIFNYVVAKMGTKNYDYRSFDRMIELKTGGLSFSNHINENKNDTQAYEEGILIESYCLERNLNDMWKIWIELFNNVDLNTLQRFETLIKMLAAKLIDGIADSGHSYAMNSAASLISPVSKHKENITGLEYLKTMKSIARTKDLTRIFQQIQEISDLVLNKNHLRTAINLSRESNDLLNGMEEFYDQLKGKPKQSHLITKQNEFVNEETSLHHVFPYTVNYCAKVISTVGFQNPDYAVLQVLAKLITSIHLLPEVREKGGAYGTGALTMPEGLFTFFSFRDPHSNRTLDLFDSIYDFLSKYEFPLTDINEAKLGVFQKIDAPVAPSNRGMIRFLQNLTYDDVQVHRERIKAVSKEQLINVVDKYFKPDRKGMKVARAILGAKTDSFVYNKSQNWQVIDYDDRAEC